MCITDTPLRHRNLRHRPSCIANIGLNDGAKEDIPMRTSVKNWFYKTIATCSLGAAAWGCSLDASVGVPGNNPPPPPPVIPTGTITQRWSIGGQFDARTCTQYGANEMQLVIRDQSGRIAATAYQPCSEMQMSVKLPIGSYTGDAWLIAADGTRVSTTLSLTPFQIVRNTETFIDTDFPTNSFLTSGLFRSYGTLVSNGEALEANDEAIGATSDALESDADDDVVEENP
jgi:hypothetical protein